MQDWKSILKKLVRFGSQLPEELQMCFHAIPPAQCPLPKEIPASPVLQELYWLCDGASIGHFSICGRSELKDLSEGSFDDEYEAGRYLVFGDTEYGHPLVWDSTEDRVGYHDQDGVGGLVMSAETGAKMMGLSLEAFLEFIFARPARTRDEASRLWARTLDELDRFP